MFSLSFETKALQGAATPASEKSTNWRESAPCKPSSRPWMGRDPVPWKATTLDSGLRRNDEIKGPSA
jgi:hypothetical protein